MAAAKPTWFKILTFGVVLVAVLVSRYVGPLAGESGPTDPKPSGESASDPTATRSGNVSSTDATDALRAIAKKGDAAIEAAYAGKREKVWIESVCEVERILRDDTVGHKHQQFIVRTPSGRTIKVAHNIDLAPRVPVERGDVVHIYGRYEYEERGGVLHWTHHDPGKRIKGGWIRHEGETYR